MRAPPALSPQLGADALLFVGVNIYGVFVRVLAERAQRRAFLQARGYIEDRLRLEDENEKQVSGVSTRGGVGAPRFWGGVGMPPGSGGVWGCTLLLGVCEDAPRFWGCVGTPRFWRGLRDMPRFWEEVMHTVLGGGAGGPAPEWSLQAAGEAGLQGWDGAPELGGPGEEPAAWGCVWRPQGGLEFVVGSVDRDGKAGRAAGLDVQREAGAGAGAVRR